MDKLNLNDIASFTWDYGSSFFLETSKGNFVWSDPDYQGTNEIHPYRGSYSDWCKENRIPYGRDKGKHFIKDYCGEAVKIL